MNSACRRSVATLLLSTALAVLPGSAVAAGVVFIKGGAMHLMDNSQSFDTPAHIPENVTLDETSYKTINAGWELRLRHGWAVGTEYLGYNHRFTSSASPSARGTAETDAFMVSGKKYFFNSGNFYPYVGGGFGIGFTDISNEGSGGQIEMDLNTSILLHAMLGVELRIDHLSFLLEAKHMKFDIRHIDVEYDPTATGMFLGVGFNW